MAEKVISQRVVSEKVVSQPGILGKVGNKFNDIGVSIGGLCAVPFIFLIALGLLIYSENTFKHSEVVVDLPLEQASEVAGQNGLKKFQGDMFVENPLNAPQIGDVAYYSYKIEEYKEVEETRQSTETVVENGQNVERTIEETVLVEKWIEEESDTEWASIRVGDIAVRPDKAKLELEYNKKTFLDKDADNATVWSEQTVDSFTPKVGDRRLSVTYLPIGESLLIVGEVSNNTVASGDVFIVSNKSDAQLTSDLESQENTMYWVIKGAAFFFFFISIMTLVRPVLEFVEIIPIAGKAASTAATFIGLTLAFLIVLIGTFVVKFWWLFLGLFIASLFVGGFLIYKYAVGRKVDSVETVEK